MPAPKISSTSNGAIFPVVVIALLLAMGLYFDSAASVRTTNVVAPAASITPVNAELDAAQTSAATKSRN